MLDINRHTFIAYSEHTEEQRNPELKLLRAVLCRAILDYSFYRRQLKKPSNSLQALNSKKKNYKKIRDWFKSTDYEEFSFLWICEHLFPQNPEVIIKKIRVFVRTKDYRFKIAGVC